jgi:hypothetical protein
MSTSMTEFLDTAVERRESTHATPAHAVPDPRSDASMGLLVDDVVLPIGAQSLLIQAIELYRDARCAAAASSHGATIKEEGESRAIHEEGSTALDVGQRSEGLRSVHAVLDRLEAFHLHQRDVILRAQQLPTSEKNKMQTVNVGYSSPQQ